MYNKTTHPKLYNTWRAMKGRCNNSKQLDYKYYGEKNIKVYEDWNRFLTFALYSLSSGYIEGMTIDRIDTNKDYTPDNSQWLSLKDNVIKNNKNRYLDRYNKAYYYWLSKKGVVTAKELSILFEVTTHTGRLWIIKFKGLK